LAYVGSRGHSTGEVYVVQLSADKKPEGQPNRITFRQGGVGFPVWTADGHKIVFMEGNSGSNGSIARVTLDGKGASRKIPGLGYTAGPIALSHDGRRLAFSRGGQDSDIWRIDLSGQEPPRKLVASTRQDLAGAYSPDGKRIAFASNRSGPREVCDADGGNPVQLTHFGGPQTGTTRWSPDSRYIAFDSRPGGNADIYIVGAEGGSPRRLTDQPGEDARPSWSADGKWIYFSSDRSGASEIWRMPPNGGDAMRITKGGGVSAMPSIDGQWIYYRPQSAAGPLRQIRPDGSDDSEAISLPINILTFLTTPKGVYFALGGRRSRETATLQALLFATGKITEVSKLDFPFGLGLSLSPDERYALLTKLDQNGTDLMLVDSFR